MLLKLATLGALGYLGYRIYDKNYGNSQNEAFATGEAGGENFVQIRNAGPAAMRDSSARKWTKADEESDESFPASDPPANY